MEIRIKSYMVPNQSTVTKPTKCKLVLEATGNEMELEWYMQQLNKIGQERK